ncbi:MAG: hypothetical protein H8E98_06075 [Bacteroidetes bacterium]|nr:hypothetical protein [Bacteroidota bacterium]
MNDIIIKLQENVDKYKVKRSKKGFTSRNLSKFEMFTVRLDYLLSILNVMTTCKYINMVAKVERVKKIKDIKQHAFSSKNKHGKFTGMSKDEIDYLAEVWNLYVKFLKEQNATDEEIKNLLVVSQ